MLTVAKYLYTVDSRRRSQGTNTDFNLLLSQPLQKKAKDSLFSIRVVSATIPFSFYQLSSEYNQLQVTFSDGTHTKDSTLTLTPGNYTTSSIANYLSSLLTTECQISSGAFVGFNPQLTFTYSSVTGEDTFIMGSPTGSITLKFGDNQNLGIFFGFSSNITISSLTPQTSPKTAVANPVNRLYIRSGDLHQLNNREWIVETDTFSDIIYEIPITTNQNTYIHWIEPQESVLIIDEFINSFNIYLSSNLSYTPLDLRGLDWSFTMYIEEVVLPQYTPILATTFAMRTDTSEQEKELLKMRDEQLQKMEQYKNKLLKKIPDKTLLSTIKDAILSKPTRSKDLPNQQQTEEPLSRRTD